MKQCVKIIQCSNPIMWYKDLIGECYEVKFIDDFDKSYVVDLADSTGNMGSVLPQDAEVFEIEDDESVRPFEEILTEAQIEHLDTLEALATVYEELMLLKEQIGGGVSDDTSVCEANS